MASTLSLIFLTLTPLLLFSHHQTLAQEAPAPSSGPANLTGILTKAGQYTTFIRLLSDTQVGNQIDNQLNSSTEGLTVLAPTDNAFNNLKAGTLNGLSTQDQVDLILYHVLPKYYTLDNFQTVSNPVRTQFSDDGLNFTSQGHQLNVSTGLVETQINNALWAEFPLAVYQSDAVLLPPSLFGAKSPASAPPPEKSSSTTPADSGDKTKTKEAAAPSENSTGDSSKRNVGLGLVAGLLVVCMGVLS